MQRRLTAMQFAEEQARKLRAQRWLQKSEPARVEEPKEEMTEEDESLLLSHYESVTQDDAATQE